MSTSAKVFKIFVADIPWTAASKEIREYFTKFGQVRRCFLPFDKNTGFHKGHCWVTFKTEEDMYNVLKNGPHVVDKAMLRLHRDTRSFEELKPDREFSFE